MYVYQSSISNPIYILLTSLELIPLLNVEDQLDEEISSNEFLIFSTEDSVDYQMDDVSIDK